ncbi:MAG: TIGR00269 family protein [Euryarchaeota archaeon RBG_19FT_COMBO_56_21]|nr:MAG: TIGR00269 family protein [Euryarchaeota archaeon RBG_19FT_COMBO_56_21]
MTSCDKCRGRAIVHVRYSGAHLCRSHFCDFVERRVRHEFRKQMDLKGGERIAIAVSGGKDSTVAQYLIHKILGPRRSMDLCAITVDEGISGYRESSIPVVARNCKSLGMDHIVVSFADLHGITMDEIAEAERGLATCSFCGVLRRGAMNRAARDWMATHLATGLNLDDTCQSVLMNFARGDIERLARLGPHRKVQKGLVPRIQPLRLIPESETTLYAIANGLEYHDLECPYAPEALRNQYRAVIAQLEDKSPGTRHSILRSYDALMPALEKMFPPSKLRSCTCGEPSISDKCKACELVESLRRK